MCDPLANIRSHSLTHSLSLSLSLTHTHTLLHTCILAFKASVFGVNSLVNMHILKIKAVSGVVCGICIIRCDYDKYLTMCVFALLVVSVSKWPTMCVFALLVVTMLNGLQCVPRSRVISGLTIYSNGDKSNSYRYFQTLL